MTYEEAIENLRHNCDWYNENECVYFFGNKNCEQCEFHVAIESIEKQIPHKVDTKKFYGGALCPSCGELFEKHMDNWKSSYCQYCGVKLDWGGEG